MTAEFLVSPALISTSSSTGRGGCRQRRSFRAAAGPSRQEAAQDAEGGTDAGCGRDKELYQGGDVSAR